MAAQRGGLAHVRAAARARCLDRAVRETPRRLNRDNEALAY
jgi:hypothetical protein